MWLSRKGSGSLLGLYSISAIGLLIMCHLLQKNVVLQRLYLGKIPPVFTFFRAGRHPTDGDHVVGLRPCGVYFNYLTAWPRSQLFCVGTGLLTQSEGSKCLLIAMQRQSSLSASELTVLVKYQVLEMTVNFSAARDMHASMAVQMRKRVGLGIWASFQISNIQVEGKVRPCEKKQGTEVARVACSLCNF